MARGGSITTITGYPAVRTALSSLKPKSTKGLRESCLITRACIPIREQQRADQPEMPWEFQEVGSDRRDEDLVTRDVLVATIPKREAHDVLK